VTLPASSTTIFAFAVAVTVTGCEIDDQEVARERERPAAVEPVPEPAFPAVSDSMIAAGAGEAWPTHGGDPSNQRYSALDQVHAGNVADLVPVWIRGVGLEGAFEATPIVVGNTMYVSTARGRVVALDAATGQQLWRYEPSPPLVTLCCGPTNSGVSVYGEAVYVTSLDAKLIALFAESGEVIWEADLGDPAVGYSATMAPLAADGRVYAGVSGERYGIRGFLAAFDANSGEELWRWHTVPTPDEGGWWGEWAENDPFGTPLGRDVAAERADSAVTGWTWSVGGGGIATTPAYDRSTGRLFVNVEGPAPLVDGAGRPGDNLYTGSIVALDAATGEMVWHAQYLPHDIWGLSGGSPPFLFDRGGERHVGFAGRTGWVYVFSAETGQPILRSDNFVPQEALLARPSDEDGVRIAPGANGGNPGTGVAYDPTTGIAYVGGVHQPMVYTRSFQPFGEGRLWLGGDVRYPPGEEQWGTVTAIDLGDGGIRWQKRTPAPVYSDALATAGGLVFVGQGSGSLDAFDAATGRLLWQFHTGAGVHGGPITYQVAGVQYIAAPAGGSTRFGTGPGDDLIAFALASSRPSPGERDYPEPRYTRGGATPAGQGGVRQVDLDSLDAAAADTAPHRGDSTRAGEPGGVDEEPRRR
jgi:alcohol dehydrogenase (cytochrome c)